jgi:hypothetical protein
MNQCPCGSFTSIGCGQTGRPLYLEEMEMKTEKNEYGTYEVHQTFRIYGDDKSAYLEVGEDGDCLGLIEVRTVDLHSENYYGKIRLPLMPKLARLLGQTLIKMADEMEK